MKRLVALTGVCVLMVACAGTNEVTGDRRVVGSVSITFAVRPARVEVGKPARFALRLSNVAGTPVVLTFPTSQRYDFWVTRGRTEVWRWSSGRFFVQTIEKQSIAPLGTLALTEPWTPKTAGTFIVHGDVYADGYRQDMTGELRVGV